MVYSNFPMKVCNPRSLVRLKTGDDDGMSYKDALDLFMCLSKGNLRFTSEGHSDQLRSSVSGSIWTDNPDALVEIKAMATALSHRVNFSVSRDIVQRSVTADFQTSHPDIVQRLMDAQQQETDHDFERSEKKRIHQEMHAEDLARKAEERRVQRERQEQYVEEALF